MSNVRFEPVIGLEVHAQLKTRSKMFCGCDAQYFQAIPNSHVCAVCCGMPGALPVINRRAVDMAVLTALALGCSVAPRSKFDRKNYPYPDLPKGYQISQYDRPLGQNGRLEYLVGETPRHCGIVRVHLEEDTGKSLHSDDNDDRSFLDYNRCGVPLMEIVGEPDLRSAAEARAYFETLRQVLMYLDVCDGNLQEGSMRADVNVSLREFGAPYGTQVEIKNLNSFRAVFRALEYEIERQADVLQRGEKVIRETRGWSEKREVTISQRSKEQAHDYRYFPEPDLPPLVFTDAYLGAMRGQLPELPDKKVERFREQYGLAERIAQVLTQERVLAGFFEDTVRAASRVGPKVIANWIVGDALRLAKETGSSITNSKLTPPLLGELLSLLQSGAINGTAAKVVLETVFTSGEAPADAMTRLGLGRIADPAILAPLVRQVLQENQPLVDTYLAGKTNALQAIRGKIMKATDGKADMNTVDEIIAENLQVRR